MEIDFLRIELCRETIEGARAGARAGGQLSKTLIGLV